MTVPRSPSLQSELPLTHIFATTEKERQSLAETLQNVAEKHKGNMNFATIDATRYSFFAEALGLALDRFPAVVIEDVINGETVPFDQDEEITADAIEKFIENYFRMSKTAKVEIKVRPCRLLLLVEVADLDV
jgi:protein disulfide-isomerase A1